jgi:hypothetical protein
MNKKMIVSISLLAILVISLFAGMIFYYNQKISSLSNQISKLNSTIANFPIAHLVSSLGITEMLGNESNSMGKPTPIPYNYLYITGSVNNTGVGTAFNAGLLVVAYDAYGTLEINMTVPLGGGIFGSDNATDTFVLEHYGSYDPALGVYVSNFNPTLGIVDGKQIAYIGGSSPFYGPLSIIHEGLVTNWTVTPVWTNTP